MKYPFCKDCNHFMEVQHYQLDPVGDAPQPLCTKSVRPHPVSGIPAIATCLSFRYPCDDDADACGLEAKFYQPRHTIS